MMAEYNKEKLIEGVKNELFNYETGIFITLNALTQDNVKFECQVEQLAYWLNCYCYGRCFKKGKKRLKIIGASELGTVNQGLHMHLMVMHKNDTERILSEIEDYIRKKWYRLIRAKPQANKYGSLVNLKFIDDIHGCIRYITKTFYHQPYQFNLQYF